MIKFGIVGIGTRGSLFADTIMQNPYAELVAVSEINEESLAKAKDKYQATGYTDVEEMIQNEVLDALVISTPDFLHYKPVMLAAKKGIHIMVEKPFPTQY